MQLTALDDFGRPAFVIPKDLQFGLIYAFSSFTAFSTDTIASIMLSIVIHF
jgi:hypothetical protein